MEWWVAFTIIVGALCVLMVIGMPIAFAFLARSILDLLSASDQMARTLFILALGALARRA